MKNQHDVVKGLLRTEKGSLLLEQKKYLFWVATDANKIEIKHAIEQIYKVKVASVNTTMARGKLKRVRYKVGKSSDWKKAIVTLKDGKIDIA